MARKTLTYIAWAVAVAACATAFVLAGSAMSLWAAVLAFAVPLAGFALVAFASRGISVSLEGEVAAPKGSDVTCILVVSNTSRLPVPKVDVDVEVENLLTLQECTTTARASVAPRDSARIPIRIASDTCGRVECRATRWRACELSGIFGRTRACDASRRISIMPGLQDVYLRNVLSASPLADTTTYSPDRKGADLSEVFALREYEPGDDIRRMHWKLSSKLDEYVVREPSLPLDNSIMVFWDKTLYGADTNPLQADSMAEVVLAICERLVAEGVQFNVASNDVAAGRCFREYITDENDIYELIGHLMSSPLGDDDAGGLEQYARMYGGIDCSRLIYVSAGFPPAAEELSGRIDVIAFVCDEGDSVEVDGGTSKIHFRSGGAEAALSLAEVV